MQLDDQDVLDESKWLPTGNLLGRTLTKIRQDLFSPPASTAAPTDTNPEINSQRREAQSEYIQAQADATADQHTLQEHHSGASVNMTPNKETTSKDATPSIRSTAEHNKAKSPTPAKDNLPPPPPPTGATGNSNNMGHQGNTSPTNDKVREEKEQEKEKKSTGPTPKRNDKSSETKISERGPQDKKRRQQQQPQSQLATDKSGQEGKKKDKTKNYKQTELTGPSARSQNTTQKMDKPALHKNETKTTERKNGGGKPNTRPQSIGSTVQEKRK